jgi:hypothetical protein
MDSSAGRLRAERALEAIRELTRNEPGVLGSGLAKESGAYVVLVIVRKPIPTVPTRVDHVSVIQDVRKPPEPWVS